MDIDRYAEDLFIRYYYKNTNGKYVKHNLEQTANGSAYINVKEIWREGRI